MASFPAIEPLLYPAAWPSPSKFELFCRWVPVAGWLVGMVLQHRRIGPIVDELDRQFDSRPPVPVEYWDDELRRHIAHSLIESCVQACGWPHEHFIPSDAFGVMMEWRTGDGCEIDAMFRIEDALQLKLSNAEWKMLCELTLNDTVEYLAKRAQAASV
jgi:hypothetical protein